MTESQKNELGIFKVKHYGYVRLSEVFKQEHRKVCISLYNEQIMAYDERLINASRERTNSNDDISFFMYEFEGFSNSYHITEGCYELELLIEDSDNSNPALNCNESSSAICGKVIFSASPLTVKNAWVVLRRRLTDQIGMTNDQKSKEQLKKIVEHAQRLKAAIRGGGRAEAPYAFGCNPKIKLFNVGQANCAHITFRRYRSVLVDIGHPIHMCESERKKTDRIFKQKISHLSPEYVMLTHWDLDHIAGVCMHEHYRKAPSGAKKSLNDRNSLYNKKWIAPDPVNANVGLTALRLCVFLMGRIGGIQLVDTKTYSQTLISSSQSVDIYSGKCTTDNVKNDFGLIYTIKGNSEKFLFPGDADYAVFPTTVKNEPYYHYILVSHHGAEMSPISILGKFDKKETVSKIECKTLYDKSKCKKTEDRSAAFITSGIEGGYNHPHPKHLLDLEANNFAPLVLCRHCADYFEIILR